jgi:hypothetical protein
LYRTGLYDVDVGGLMALSEDRPAFFIGGFFENTEKRITLLLCETGEDGYLAEDRKDILPFVERFVYYLFLFGHHLEFLTCLVLVVRFIILAFFGIIEQVFFIIL